MTEVLIDNQQIRNCANIADKNLKRQGFQTFLPMEEETRQRNGKFVTAMRPLFPGYIFVAFDVARGFWRTVNSTYGVTRLVNFGKEPTAVPLDLVSQLMLRCDAKGKNEQAQMVRSILPDGIECIFVRQPEQLGLGHAVLCAERAVGNDPFAVLLADDFLTYEGAGVTADLVKGYEASCRTQLSVMEVDGPDISKYGVVQPGAAAGSVAGLVEKPTFEQAPSNLASIGRYVLTPDIFEILRGQAPGAGGEIQLADAINTQAAAGQVEAVTLNGQRFDCGSVKGFLQAIMHVAERDGLV